MMHQRAAIFLVFRVLQRQTCGSRAVLLNILLHQFSLSNLLELIKPFCSNLYSFYDNEDMN